MPDLSGLSARIDSSLGVTTTASQPKSLSDDERHAQDRKKRDLFIELARVRIESEKTGNAETVGQVDEVRKKLRLSSGSRPTSAVAAVVARLDILWRLALTILMTSWGCLVLTLLAPLRLTHPTLRRFGVPNGLLPMDLLTVLWSKSVLHAAGVHVHVVGGDKTKSGAMRQCWSDIPHGIVVYNHASNLDPFIVVVACAGHRSPKFVGKKVLFTLPIFGWAAAALGHVPIDRGDRTKSIETMNDRVASIMKRWGRSVAVSPEGTRTKDGHLVLPFKKGVFHLSQKTGAPLLPMVIRGAYDLWPPSRVFARTGVVTVRLLEPQKPPTLPPPTQPPVQGKDGVDSAKDRQRQATDEARIELQRTYVEHMASHRGEGEDDVAMPLSWYQWLGDVCFVTAALLLYLQLGRGCYSLLLTSTGMGGNAVVGMLCLATITISFLVHHIL